MEALKTRLLEPRSFWWEADGLSWPTVMSANSSVNLFYQATGQDGINRLSGGVSDDGESFTWLNLPIFEGFQTDSADRLGVGRPRFTQINKKPLLLFETIAIDSGQGAGTNYSVAETPWQKRIVIAETPDLRRFKLTSKPFPTLNATDGVLVSEKISQRFWLIYALDGQIFCSHSHNLRQWDGGLRLAIGNEDWEKGGIFPAFIQRTDQGWLLFYNARSERGRSSVGVMLTDLANPAVVLKRVTQPILTATESWERGSLAVGGGMEKRGSFWLYYGAGASLGLAKLPLESLLTALDAQTNPTHA